MTVKQFSPMKTALLIGIITFLAALLQEAGARVYVSKNGSDSNDGASWATAYQTLEAAVSKTIAAEEFWIAEGTYTPVETLVLGDRQNHSYYGGFAGDETSLDQRDITAHPTIIDGRGILRHVFNVTSWVDTVRFDGLTITGGAATATSGPDSSGGAVIVDQASAVITGCTFTGNTAYWLGGAINLVNNAAISITNSTFTNNSLTGAGGGGAVYIAWNLASSAPIASVRGCLFHGNSGGTVGGAFYSHTFPVEILESTFINNSSENGGAVMLDFNTGMTDTIKRCGFFGNSAPGPNTQGGAICTWERTLNIENSVFSGNSAAWGGAVRLHGGGVANYSGTIASSTFYGNTATDGGGALRNLNVSMLDIHNSIFWGNQAGHIQYDTGCENNYTVDMSNLETSVTIRHTDMLSLDWCHGSDSEVHIESFAVDPDFVDPDGSDNMPGTADDNLSIANASPCTDRADGNLAPAADLVFRQRYDNPAVPDQGAGTPPYSDIGAYEGPYQPPPPPPAGTPGEFNIVPILNLLLGNRPGPIRPAPNK